MRPPSGTAILLAAIVSVPLGRGSAPPPDRAWQQAGGQPEFKIAVDTDLRSPAITLQSVDALPAHIATSFRDPVAFTQTVAGDYLVFDRRAQGVYRVDRARTGATRIVEVGPERGHIYRPTAFGAEPGGSFVVADLDEAGIRIQRFAERGYLLNAFALPGRPGPQVAVGGFAGAGVTSLQTTGDSIYLSDPRAGALIVEYAWNGRSTRAFGALRPTGQESDRAVHETLNAGLPLVDPTGGFFFVFQTGIPAFRKYDAAGRLVFERHIEGRELDTRLATQPSAWPRRRTADGGEWPAVPLLVTAAAADAHGRLWVALSDPFVYVYSPDGDKIHTYQLRGAGPLAATSLFFAGSSRLLVTPGCYIFEVPAA